MKVFKQAVRLTKQSARITAALEGINPLNAVKKRDEALEQLNKFIPIMEGFETQIKNYPWSSYNEYTDKRYIVDSAFVFELVSKEEFEAFNNHESTEKIMEYEKAVFRVTDREAKDIMEKISKCSNPSEFQQKDSGDKKRYIREFREAGMSISQINRLTGASKSVIERA